MLTFFRRFRKSLLDMGAAQRYLLYAIGEILLVMIGILLALQVNNWNEWRKDRVQERNILLNLAENLETNVELLNKSIGEMNEQQNSSQIIFSFFKNEVPYSDTLDRHFYQAVLMGAMQGTLTKDGYESFKNAGFELIRSESLKKEIINIFEVFYEDLEKWRGNMVSFNPVFMEMRIAEFFQLENGMKPQNEETIVGSNHAQSTFYTVYKLRSILIDRLRECLDESQKVHDLVLAELGDAQ